MIEEGLKVKFIGDDGNLTKTFAQLQEQAKRFKKALGEATNAESFARINRALDETKSRMQQLGSMGTKNFDGLTKSANRSGAVLTDFSRIAQDAAYGPLAIANNISPAIESFQRLRAETGSTKAALGQMVSGLAGGAGIGVAFGIVTAAIGFAQMGLSAWNRTAKDHKEKIADAKKVLQEYVEGLDDITRASVQGAQNAQQELVSLQSLYAASQNQNLSLSERRKAVDELQSQYPAYFKNLSDEAILAGKGSEAYGKLTNAILASARARAAQDELVEIQKQLLALENQRVKATTAYANAQKETAQVVKDATQSNATSAGREATAVTNQTKIRRAIDAKSDAEKNYIKLVNQEIDLINRAKSLAGTIQQNVEQNGVGVLTEEYKLKAKPDKESAKQAVFDLDKIIKEMLLNPQYSFVPNIVMPDSGVLIDRFTQNFKEEFLKGAKIDGSEMPFFNIDVLKIQRQQVVDEYAKLFNSIGKDLPKTLTASNGLEIDTGFFSMPDDLAKGLTDRYKEQTAELMKQSQVVSGALMPAFQGLFSAIAAGEDPVQGFFEGVKQSVNQLIQQLLAAALQAMVFSALSGGGTSFAAAFGKITGIGKFANGGIIQGPTLGLMGEYAGAKNNPEVVAPLNKLRSMLAGAGGGGNVVVTGTLRGNDMILQNARTGRTQRRNR